MALAAVKLILLCLQWHSHSRSTGGNIIVDAHPGPSNAAVMFASTDEVEEVELKVTGTIPDWLQGALIRNSPAGYENGEDEMRHMFDAWAKLNIWKVSSVACHPRNLAKYLFPLTPQPKRFFLARSRLAEWFPMYPNTSILRHILLP